MALLQYKCPSCSGAIEFDSNLQKMKCPYCDTEFEVEVLKNMDAELEQETSDDINWNSEAIGSWGDEAEADMSTYECRSCGARIVADKTTTASSCPFCDNPIVMMGGLKGELKPDLVIPFKLDKKAAKEGFIKHLSDKKLLPPVFKKENHIDEIKGIYVPFWIYDAEADASMRFTGTKVRTYRQGQYDCTETSYYKIFRSGSMAYDNITVDGSQKMDDALMDSLEPFDLRQGVDFQTAYLAGYLADRYDVSAQECSKRAELRVRNTTEAAFRATAAGYSSLTTDMCHVNTRSGHVRYGLLPVWILNTTWRGEKYVFAMNGQTGKFVGNLPCDSGLFWKMVIKFGAIGSVAAYLVAYLINMLM